MIARSPYTGNLIPCIYILLLRTSPYIVFLYQPPCPPYIIMTPTFFYLRCKATISKSTNSKLSTFPHFYSSQTSCILWPSNLIKLFFLIGYTPNWYISISYVHFNSYVFPFLNVQLFVFLSYPTILMLYSRHSSATK